MLDNPIDNKVVIDITDEMRRSYLDYAMSVIVSRALPDVRDGLKPVHRRILYAMYESGYHYNKAYRKSARVVGDVIGKYHPHGDTAVYDSMVRMAQDFSMRLMLVDGQGNFGSIDGDAPAAMRYTESRLTKAAHSLLEDLHLETVDFKPNYDNNEEEPVILPAVIPNILINGSGGIAVGMATNIPPHNLGEVIDACCAYVDNNDIEIEEICTIIKGPDFPTAGTIIGVRAIHNAYKTGKGIIAVRGKAHIEEDSKSKESIIITEIPYMVNKAKLVEKIADLVREKKIEGITDLRDESDKSGIRVVIEVKRDASANVILNQLYSYTQLQNSFGINMLALDLGMPKLMNIKEIITAFVKFRKEVINRRTLFLLKEARAKSHLLLGLRVAIDNIDEVIAIIRNSSDSAEARVKLLDKLWQVDDAIRQLIELIDEAHLSFSGPFKFTEAQVKAILEMRLQRLTGMEKEKIEQELNKLSSEIAYYLSILNSEPELLALLKKELIAAKEEFATKRLTEIETIELNGYEIEDLINREDMVVTVTLTGYIKRVALSHYRAQNRGGKGRMALSMDDADATTQVFVGSTHTPILFFSSLGQVYYLKLYKLPLGSPQAKGKALVNLLPLKKGETITNIMALPENTEEWKDLYILFATAQGGIRRNSLADFSYIPSNGKIAIKLQDDDTLIGVRLAKEENHIFLATSQGKAIRFPVEKLRVFKSRSSDGVISMRLANGDHIVGITILEGIETTQEYRESYLEIPLEKRRQIAGGELKNLQLNLVDNSDNKLVFEDIEKLAKAEQFILSVTENGFGKCTSAYQYRVTNRGGSGITNLAISKKTGNVVSVLPVTTTDELILVTNTGKMIRCKLDNVRITGRNTSGVILFKTAKDEHVVSASLVAQEDEIVEADIQSV